MGWMPCSGLETVDGMVWVKRLVQKARRMLESERAGTDLMNGYLFGENDYVDGKVLRFLGIRDVFILDTVRGNPDDASAARTVLARSGRSPEELRAFGARLRKSMAGFAFMEADEGRMPPGPLAWGIKFFYNRLLMPVVYAQFRWAGRRRRATG